MRGQFIRRPEKEPAAMDIEHDRALACQARRPDVQLQHVLALVAVVPVLKERLLDARPVMEILRTVPAVNQSWILILPGFRRLGRQPAVLAACVLTVWNTFKGEHTSIHKTPNLTVLCVRDCSAGRRTVSGFLVGGGFGAIERNSRLAHGKAKACRR